ncbi:MAG TPA: hypothetical protein VGE72_15345 [Azospirillum sp.]
MPKISITLPSLRARMLIDTIQSLYAASVGHELEIVVVSPFEVEGPFVRHVPEGEPRGNCAAHALGYEASSGDIVIAMSDDHRAVPGWLDGLADTVAERESRFFPFAGGLARPNCPHFGAAYGLYYPYFPVMSRRSIEAAGGWFSRAFTAHFADPDLGLRVWRAGGRCELLPDARILAVPVSDAENAAVPFKSKAFPQDFATFARTYHAGHGAGFLPDLREICADYPIEYLSDGTFAERCPPRVFHERRAAGKSHTETNLHK